MFRNITQIVKNKLFLLRGVTPKNNGDFYCLNCLHSFRTKTKLESRRKVCKNKDFCNVIVSSQSTKRLEFNLYQKPVKAAFIIYAGLECIIEKIDRCKNDPENSSTAKVSEYVTASGFSMSLISSFKIIENKHDVYRGKDYKKKFSEFLRELAMKAIN